MAAFKISSVVFWLLKQKWLIGGVAVAALLAGAYYWAYEQGSSSERTACEARMNALAMAVSEAALLTARRDYERSIEIQEALREERRAANEYRRALRNATGDLADCRLDDYRLCVAQSAARGDSPEACASDGSGTLR